jgi:hypothetical protein
VAGEAIQTMMANQLAEIGERGAYDNEICFDVTTKRVLLLDTFHEAVIRATFP